ncbi:MAG: aminoacyl-tRNA hydrolase [Planctomycetaceae bacterium]|jgi:PTH1 family peptidyl-tRNA hydrolase
MKVIVGLGNPGARYQGTRHNVGFDIVDQLARRWLADGVQTKFQAEFAIVHSGGSRVLLVKPLTYMNRSGEAVQQICRFYQVEPESVVVICDDMNLPLGRIRWRAGGSAGGQKGLADIIQRLGTDKVPRLRIGVDRPPGKMDPAAWVLARFRAEDREEVELVSQTAADSVETWLAEGVSGAMNRYNGSGKADSSDS